MLIQAAPAEPASARASGKRNLALVIFICFFVMLGEGFDIQAIGLAAPRMMPDLGIGPALKGAIFGIGQWGVAIGALVGGYLADRWNRRAMLFASILIFGLTTAAMAYASGFVSLMVLRSLSGLGLGAAIPSVIALAINLAPPAKRVGTVATIMAGMPLGGALAAAVATVLMPVWGWRIIFFFGGALPLLAALLVPLLPIQDTPDDQAGQRSPRAKPKLSMLFSGQPASFTLAIWLVYFITLLLVYLLLLWLPSMMVANGVPEPLADLLSLAFNFAAIVGNLVLGRATDKLGYRRVVPAIYFLLIGAAAIVAFSPSYAFYMVGFALLGFLLLGGQNCVNGILPSFYPVEARSLAIGAAVGIGRVGSIVGPLYAGIAFAADHSPQTVLLTMIGLTMIAALAITYALRIGRPMSGSDGMPST